MSLVGRHAGVEVQLAVDDVARTYCVIGRAASVRDSKTVVPQEAAGVARPYVLRRVTGRVAATRGIDDRCDVLLVGECADAAGSNGSSVSATIGGQGAGPERPRHPRLENSPLRVALIWVHVV